MESTYSKRFLFASADETECYLYPKRIKKESNQKMIEKEEQQRLEQSMRSVNSYQSSPNERMYLSERQTSWASGKLTSENKQSTKKGSPENENQIPMKDGVSFNICGQPLEEQLHNNVWDAANMCKNLCGLNPPQVQQNNIEQNNKRNGDNDLKQNSSVTSLNRDLLQMEMLSFKSVSDKKWKKYQLLQTPFVCGTSSLFSHLEHKKNNFLKKVYTAEDKDYSSKGSETTIERDNKEKNISSSIIPTLKPFKSLQLLEIPNFQFRSISNKINSKMPSTHLKEMDWKSFKGQPSWMQSGQIHGLQKPSEIGKQELQNDKSDVKASTIGSEFKEKIYPSVSKQEHSALAEGRKASVTYFRDNSTDIECNQIFAENYYKDKVLENSDSDDDQKSRIYIYISVKNIENEKCMQCNDLLKKMRKRSSNENMSIFHIQMNSPVITEVLEKNKLDIYWGVHNSNSDILLYEAESKLSTKQILDFNRYSTKNVLCESNCPNSIVQNFAYSKMRFDIFRGKEMFKLKFSLENLFAWVRTWAKFVFKGMPRCQDDSVTHWFHVWETFNEKCGAPELVRSIISRRQINKICICLLIIISKCLKGEQLKTILASFFNSRNILLSTEERFAQVEDHPLCGKRQVQFTSCTHNTLRQTTEFHEEKETHPSFVSSKFVERIGFELHSEQQRRQVSRSLDEEESAFLKKRIVFHNRESRLCKGRCVRKHHLLSRGIEGFSTYLRSVSHKSGMKKQSLVMKCLILLQGIFDCSSLNELRCCNITKIQYLIGGNLRFRSYFPAHSQLKSGKVKGEYRNQEISVTTVKQVKRKPSKMFNSSFHGKKITTFPFASCENKKYETTGCRNCMTLKNEATNEVTCTMKKYLGTASYINADRKEYVKSKNLQINYHNFCSKRSFSVFDTYEKIPLTNDFEDFDKILVVNQDNSATKKLSKENAVTSSKQAYNLPARSIPEQSKTTMEKCDFLLLQSSQTITPENCKEKDNCSPYSANEKVEDQNIYLNFENLFPSSSEVYQSDTLPLDKYFGNENRAVSEDGHCTTSSADKQEQSEKISATIQYLSTGSPTMPDTDLSLRAKETEPFSLQGHTQTNKAVSLESATLKQHLEYVKEQEEISDEQMRVANESKCETAINDLIMSYSEDESKTFIDAEEKLKLHLSVMNNGCLEDVKYKYLPSENKITYEFELKEKFDLVLEELHMFHEISKGNENNLSSLETNLQNNYCELNNSEAIDENMTSAPQKKICISSSVCGAIEEQNITDDREGLLNKKISNENEKQSPSEEYCISRLSNEELLHSPVAEGNLDAAYNKTYIWDPAFLPCTLFKEQNYSLQKEGGYFLSREVMRVQPLKTCKGPIRIGLSRKARPKQLHPYLK